MKRTSPISAIIKLLLQLFEIIVFLGYPALDHVVHQNRLNNLEAFMQN